MGDCRCEDKWDCETIMGCQKQRQFSPPKKEICDSSLRNPFPSCNTNLTALPISPLLSIPPPPPPPPGKLTSLFALPQSMSLMGKASPACGNHQSFVSHPTIGISYLVPKVPSSRKHGNDGTRYAESNPDCPDCSPPSQVPSTSYLILGT